MAEAAYAAGLVLCYTKLQIHNSKTVLYNCLNFNSKCSCSVLSFEKQNGFSSASDELINSSFWWIGGGGGEGCMGHALKVCPMPPWNINPALLQRVSVLEVCGKLLLINHIPPLIFQM